MMVCIYKVWRGERTPWWGCLVEAMVVVVVEEGYFGTLALLDRLRRSR